MSGPIAPFRERYRRALTDQRLRQNLLNFQRAWTAARAAAFDHLASRAPLGVAEASFPGQRARLAAAKQAAIDQREQLIARFKQQAEAAGASVYEAASAEEAVRYVVELCQRRGARLVAKGKSMVSEELFLNHALEAAGLEVVETDLGEWIIQLARETPSHMVMPAIHKSREQIGALFEARTGQPVSRQDVDAIAGVARRELRRVFAQADVGLTGANALIAETGTVVLVTNEGNGRLTSSLPPVHVVLAGWEKLLPTWDDTSAHLRLLARSGTAQDITVYTTFITGPDDPSRELHVVLVDNGRRAMADQPEFAPALRCIRCAACADVCPPYQVVGGQVFGYVYSGAIGLVNTAFHHGLDAAAGPQSLCVSCNACATVCPVEIPLPQQILRVRQRVAAAHGLPLVKRLALGLWARPGLFVRAMRLARLLQRPFVRGGLLELPLPARWSWRRPPALAPRPARAALLGRVFEPALTGPLSGAARGLTVAYFVQCLTDQFAPQQAQAAVRLLQACGARVVVPGGQHCCGLPPLDSGDRDAAAALARQTIAVLDAVQADYVVTAAASCAVAIGHDFPDLLKDDPVWLLRAERLAGRTLDLTSFLARVARLPAGALAGGDRAAEPLTYHSFCQSTNVLGIASLGPELLRSVAGLEFQPLAEAEVCCGFGGSTSLDHPEVAREIVGRKLDNVAASGARVLVTDNPGCLLHLRGAAAARGLPLRVAHLAEVLAERLPAGG